MSETAKTGLLIVIGILTLVNSVMIFTDDNGVSYEESQVQQNNPASNAAVNTQNQFDQSFENDLNAQNNDATVVEENLGPPTTIDFNKMEHDFGTIEQNTTNPYTFTFTNTGSEPLIISDARGSCGCTVPEYPREPVAPGETGEIKVVYSPGNQKNQQTKTVTITANTEPSTTVLRIKANVKPGEGTAEGNTGSAPLQIGG
jgi:hypothetical protein